MPVISERALPGRYMAMSTPGKKGSVSGRYTFVRPLCHQYEQVVADYNTGMKTPKYENSKNSSYNRLGFLLPPRSRARVETKTYPIVEHGYGLFYLVLISIGTIANNSIGVVGSIEIILIVFGNLHSKE
ncbi:hypothetical protein TNIN_315931 [Trichonephila inaurata madagascariensis]|uniref:Uncharacterized protein n=1 Tax=Trichonephila inaurata madagascariensis TaxID=2747483 RepID=A0A8X6XX76_9ARAC|nr:hypothetical protein TNIN_315931 [Trichonephila inaurata madagascariensis]